ncbi:MAG: UDPGP type 1 family protein, partial [bacterium]|nr:UDPGP type 1 family protein [bacterium]
MSKTTSANDIESRYRNCLDLLTARGQEHLLRWWDDLEDPARDHLLGQIESIPWSDVDPLIETHVLAQPEDSAPVGLEPAPYYPLQPDAEQEAAYREAAALGDELIRAGKVAAFTVAGGQGTRLGVDGPKGAVPVSPIRKKTLFQLFAESIVAVRQRFDVAVRWYIMTNPGNH